MAESFQSDFAAEFVSLNPTEQADVMGFIRGLKASRDATTSTEKLRAERNKAILALPGSISPEDLAIMKQVIEEDCERIDEDGW